MINFKQELGGLKGKQTLIHVIHYSCQSLSDANEGLSPRITSIAVQHFASDMMHSFSIHLVAEKLRIDKTNIESHYDELEKQMLAEFFKFVSEHPDSIWIHWNMSNINFGFDVLEHRYEVLTNQRPTRISDSKRKNLSDLILLKYGKDSVDHPRMENLMKLNGGLHRNYLSGKDEVAAFEAKEYIKLHNSTMSKVYWFSSMLNKLFTGRIVTQRSNWRERVNAGIETPIAKIVGLMASVFGIVQLLEWAWDLCAKLL